MIALALCLAASAADLPGIAVLPLDAPPGTASQSMAVLNRGVAAAIQAEGTLRPVVDAELQVRLTEDHAARLGEARGALSEGRRLLTAGDTAFAVVFLEDAVDAYAEAGGSYAHRQEQADAWFALARSYAELGDVGAAAQALSRTLALVPDHLEVAADAYDPEISSLADDVIATLNMLPASHLPPAAAAELAETVGTTYLVEGLVNRDGDLQLTVFRGSTALHTASRPGPLVPGRIGDPYYDDLAAEIVAACVGDPIPSPTVMRPERPLTAAPRTSRSRARWVAPVLGSLVAVGTAGVVVATTWPDPPAAVPTWSLVVTGP